MLLMLCLNLCFCPNPLFKHQAFFCRLNSKEQKKLGGLLKKLRQKIGLKKYFPPSKPFLYWSPDFHACFMLMALHEYNFGSELGFGILR